jgi:predicted MFS family arabinose efflux permease
LGGVGLTRAINRDVYSGQQYLRVTSYNTMILAITPIAAPLLGGYIQHYFGWKGNFAVLLAYDVLILSLVYLFLPETHHNREVHPPSFKIAFQAYLQALKNKRFRCFLTCTSLAFAGESSYSIVSPFLLQDKLGWSSIAFGWLSILTVLGFMIGAFCATKLAKRIEAEKMLWVGSSIMLIGSASMLLFSYKLETWVIIIPMMIYMTGMSLITIPSGVSAMMLFKEKVGVAAALYGCVVITGGGIVSALGTNFHPHNQKSLACILFVITLLIAWMVSKLWRSRALSNTL